MKNGSWICPSSTHHTVVFSSKKKSSKISNSEIENIKNEIFAKSIREYLHDYRYPFLFFGTKRRVQISPLFFPNFGGRAVVSAILHAAVILSD